MGTKGARYHGFDALRSGMLLLGVLLHVSLSYFPDSPGFRNDSQWYFYDDAGSWLAVLFYVPVHVYRMPVFFVLAGFFTGLLISKRSAAGMLQSRIKRLGLPLLVSTFVFLPTMYAAAAFAYSSGGTSALPMGGRADLLHLIWNDFHYLWFLWHLIILCLITAGFSQLLSLSSHRFCDLVSIVGNWLVTSWCGTILLLGVTALLNLGMRPWPGFIETDSSYLPAVHVLLVYGLYFSYGAALFHNPTVLEKMAGKSLCNLAIGSVWVGLFSLLLLVRLRGEWMFSLASLNLIMASFSALAAWSMIHGFLGVAIRFFNEPNSVVRYLADSSYWVYLCHMPLVFLTQGWLAPFELPGLTKLVLSATATLGLCLVSYHLLVRDTWVGVLLNGRRYPQPAISFFRRTRTA